MGGVDIADQLRSVYTSHMTTFRTWMPLLFWILDTVVTNSYMIMKDIDHEWNNSHKKFTLHLAWDLVKIHSSDNALSLSATRSQQETHTSNISKNDKRQRASTIGGYVTDQNADVLPVMRRDVQHLPDRVTHGNRRTCFQCRRKGKMSKTSTFCTTCSHFLCFEAGRNCFVELHKEVLGQQN